MRAVIQRVTEASVLAHGRETVSIGPGLAVLLGIGRDDEEADAQYLVPKILNLRIFPDEENRFNRSALETRAELLVVSQFTLYVRHQEGTPPRLYRGSPAARSAAAVRIHRGPVQAIRAKNGYGVFPKNTCRCGCRTTGR